jgi:AcrR family transcriptional regulator
MGEATDDRPKARRPRTNAERTATARFKLITAAIDCLQGVGYTATSTLMIAQAAAVSRGAMLHHFPTKVDLMLAVVAHVIECQKQFYTTELFKLARGRERYVAITGLTWTAWSQPSGIAVIEIMIAARSDAALAERLPPLLQELETSQREDVWAIAKSAGITDRDTVEASVQINLAAIRGLCIDLMVRPNREDVSTALSLLMAYKEATAEHLISRGANELGPALATALEVSPETPAARPEIGIDLVDELTADNERLKTLLGNALLDIAKLRERLQG